MLVESSNFLSNGHDEVSYRAEWRDLKEAVINSLTDHIAIVNQAGVVVAVNDAWQRSAGKSSNPPADRVGLGTNYLEICAQAAAAAPVGDTVAAQVLAGLKRVISSGQTFECEYDAHTAQERRWFVMRASLLVGGSGHIMITHTDVTLRRLAEEALQEQERQYQALLEIVPAGIFRMDPTGQHIYVNKRLSEITGLGETQVQSEDWKQVVPPDHLARVSAIWDHAIKYGLSYETELPIISPDGSEKWIISRAIPEYDAAGTVTGFVGVVVDLTERKAVEEQIGRSLQEKRLLLQEVHHRVKNNLQLISSMLSLHADTIQDERVQAIFTESKRRIRSLALIHEGLYRSEDFTGIHFDRHIRNLIDYLFISYAANRRQIEFEHRGGNVALVVDQAIPCSLIVNELVSNALKHAFPAGHRSPVNEPSRVWVALTWTAGEGHRLIIGDNGVGLPQDFELNQSASLGLRLVQALVRQLNGELSYENSNANGTIFRIHFE